ncbi:MAG: ribosome maturation factor RimM [Chloroflexota bacterium]|nr:ribosome maturation factor RimM [Chloroflexota bacterium]
MPIQPNNSSLPLARSPYMHRNQPVQVPSGYLAVGLITSLHGIKGELKIELHTDFPERFVPNTLLYIGEALLEKKVVSARPHKNQLLLMLAGVNTREAAEALRGQWLFIAEADAVELEQDSYWVHDIVGMTVQTEEGRRLGTVGEVLFTGANEVYVVQTDATVNGGKALLLPAIADVVQAVDLVAARITVRLLPGLLDEPEIFSPHNETL